MNDNKKYLQHEFIDRLYIAMSMLDDHVISHYFIDLVDDDYIRSNLNHAIQIIADVYERSGALDMSDFKGV